MAGRVLDVCTGLGYTAIGAAARPAVEQVVTIEYDPLMVWLQRANPWSDALFSPPNAGGKITRLLGDATRVLPELPDGWFDACCHDPPAQSLSGELHRPHRLAAAASRPCQSWPSPRPPRSRGRGGRTERHGRPRPARASIRRRIAVGGGSLTRV